jgi:hypothetical protein
MKTSANRDLFAYWDKVRGSRVAPERADIEPDAIRHILGDCFFLADGNAANFPFRLAGTRLCALFGRELKGDHFFNLWGRTDQAAIRKLMNAIVDEKTGLVAQATGRTTNGSPLVVNLELLMLPLLQRGPLDARVLGAIVPVTMPFWLGARFVGSLELGAMRHIGGAVDQIPAPRLVPTQNPSPVRPANSNLPNGQNRSIRSRFVVYEGGRSSEPHRS